MKSSKLSIQFCLSIIWVSLFFFAAGMVSAETQNQTQPPSSGNITFYVSNSGVDPAAPFTLPVCTLTAPCETLTFADSIADSNDTIALIGGFYNETLILDEARIIKGVQFFGPFINDCFVPCATILVSENDPAIETSADLTVKGLNFDRAPGSGKSSAIVTTGGLTLNTVTIRDMRATNGGAVLSNGFGRMLIINSNFLSNTAFIDGGAIYNAGSAEVEIIGSVFDGNSATDEGGGVYLVDNEFVTIEDSTFTNNSADIGGGLFIDGSFDQLSNGHIDNTTITNNVGFLTGAGLYIDGTELTVSQTTIDKNTAGFNGGGVYVADSALAINDSFIRENQIECDGTTRNVIAKGGGVHTANSTLTLDNTTVMTNSIISPIVPCTHIGEAISSEDSEVGLANSLLIAHAGDGVNISADSALFLTDTQSIDSAYFAIGEFTATRSEFIGNHAAANLITICNSQGDIRESSLIHTNSGSGLLIDKSCQDGFERSTRVLNSTFSCTTCDAMKVAGGDIDGSLVTVFGRMHAVEGVITFVNSIIDGQCEETINTILPDGIINFAGINIASPQTLHQCDAIIQTDPHLEPLALATNQTGNSINVHQLRSDSTAIDAISSSSCVTPTDQLGTNRSANGQCDLGAVEFTGVPAAITLSQPASVANQQSNTIWLSMILLALTTILVGRLRVGVERSSQN